MLNIFLFAIIIFYVLKTGLKWDSGGNIKKSIISKNIFILVVIISILICIFQVIINLPSFNHLHDNKLKETYVVDDNLIEESFIIDYIYYFPTENNVEKINLITYNIVYMNDEEKTDIKKVEIYERTFKNNLFYLFFDSVDIAIIY